MEGVVKNLRILSAIGVLSSMTLMSGCVISNAPAGVSSSKTIGEQMIDLKKAYENGAINDNEYKRAKQAVLDGGGGSSGSGSSYNRSSSRSAQTDDAPVSANQNTDFRKGGK